MMQTKLNNFEIIHSCHGEIVWHCICMCYFTFSKASALSLFYIFLLFILFVFFWLLLCLLSLFAFYICVEFWLSGTCECVLSECNWFFIAFEWNDSVLQKFKESGIWKWMRCETCKIWESIFYNTNWNVLFIRIMLRGGANNLVLPGSQASTSHVFVWMLSINMWRPCPIDTRVEPSYLRTP